MDQNDPNFNPSSSVAPFTTNYNNLIVGADNYNLSSGQQSWLDSTGDALTYGLHGAWTSGVNSFINTGVTVANWFGAGLEKADTYKELLESDANAAQYYAQHKEGVDLAGFIAGSMVPGFSGLKALQLAKKGEGALPTALGLFSRPRQRFIDDTINRIKQGAIAEDTIIRANKLKAIALGFGDQAIQAATWELAVTATMGAAPTLDNQDWTDIAFNLGTGVILGGAVGGIWDAFGAHGAYKKGQILADLTKRQYEAATNLGKGDFLAGDRVVTLLNSINDIPLPPTELATKTVAETYKKAVQKSKLYLAEIAPDPDVANTLLDKLLTQRDAGTISMNDMHDMLSAAVKIQRVTEADKEAKTVFYLRNAVDQKSGEYIGPVTHNPEGSKAQAYLLRDEQVKPKISTTTEFSSAADAFAGGSDIWVAGDGNAIMNPKAQNIQRTLKPGFSNTAKTEGAPIIINFRSGALSLDAIPVIGDLAESGRILVKDNATDVLHVGDTAYKYSTKTYEKSLYGEDYLDANGRHIWWARRGLREFDKININDISALDNLARQLEAGTLEPALAKTIQVVDASGIKKSLPDFLAANPKLSDYIENVKRANIFEYTEKNIELGSNGLPVGKDLRELSARFNLPQEWLENGMPKTNSLGDISVNPEEWAKPNYAKIIYSVGDPVKDIDGMIARGMPAVMGRITRAQDLASTVWMQFAKDFDSLFPEVNARFSQMKADSIGSGATAFGFNNPTANSLGEMWSSVGIATHQMKLELLKRTQDALAHGNLAIFNSEKAAAELGVLTNIFRSSEHFYRFVPGSNYIVLEQLADHVQLVKTGVTPDGPIIRMGFKDSAAANLPESYGLRIAGDTGAETLEKGKYAAYKLSDDVLSFLQASTERNDARLIHGNNFEAAVGGNANKYSLGRIYAPPIDTKKYNFWALVREPQGNGASSSSVASITAVNASDLSTKIAKAREQGLEVYTKNDIKIHHKVLGDYDYNMNLVENVVDSSLKRKGVLSDFYPETKADRVLDDWNAWHDRQETRLLRNMVELKNAQQFAELRDLGEKYVELATSRIGKVSAFTGKAAENPYDDYIKTALDLPKTAEYRLWHDANEKIEAAFDSAFRMAKTTFSQANTGKLSWEEANNVAAKYGMGKPFVNAADYMESTGMLAPKPYLRNFIQKVNSVLSMSTLGLDPMNSLINVISTPILLSHEISVLRKNYGTKEGIQRLEDLLNISLPGDVALKIPGTTKLLYNAVNASFGEGSKELYESYARTGLDVSLLRQRTEMFGAMPDLKAADEKSLNNWFKGAVAWGEKASGNKLAESYTRFIPAHVMGQIADALGIQDAGVRLAMQRSFVNRVQGNVIASQRPVAFQGVLGQAIGLFQTYQFNLMQQVFKSMENGDKKSLAILFGMQSTLYGLNGLPLFNALNTHIIGNAPGNPTHTDITTAVPRLIGKTAGDFLMYGGASWFTGAALYSRGDINPRQITVLPINPMDIPAIAGIVGVVKNIYNIGAKLNDDGNFVQTMLQGLEHNGISRPLSGLAQVIQGHSTTSSGDLIARSAETNLVSNAARMLGAKPIDEAIALDAKYRATAYQAKDSARIAELGSAVKTAFVAGTFPSDEQISNFATEYAASGGKIEMFNRFLVNAARNSNQSTINRFMQQLNKPVARNMMEIMGGEGLPDYTNIPNPDNYSNTGVRG
jgi:hypothetical protein